MVRIEAPMMLQRRPIASDKYAPSAQPTSEAAASTTV